MIVGSWVDGSFVLMRWYRGDGALAIEHGTMGMAISSKSPYQILK